MPLVSKGYILDVGFPEDDLSVNILFDGDSPLMCTLTMVDMTTNSNKFHIMHAVYMDTKGYVLYTRSGRTGNKGRVNLKTFASRDSCISEFKKLFKTLTANVWEFRDKFEHRMGHHAVFSFGEKNPDIEEKVNISPEVRSEESKLDFLVNLFCGEETTKNAICAMNFDYAKLPVGIIAHRNIEIARSILEEIKGNISELSPEKISRYSERYYSVIPINLSRGSPPKLDSLEIVNRNIEHLEDLSNITRTIEIIQESSDDPESRTKRILSSTNHTIRALLEDDPMYGKIMSFVKNSHGKTHSFTVTPLHIYEVLNTSKKALYDMKFGSSSRKELLVHGSRLCNWRSILEKGLLLDPSKTGAVITGKMFGNGIYWANSFSKSAQYCGTDGYSCRKGAKEKICLAIAEVAVGKQLECFSGFNHCKSTIGSNNSVYGVGKYTPSSYDCVDDVYIPSGGLDYKHQNASLYYDEKVIYDEDQYYFRYLVVAEKN